MREHARTGTGLTRGDSLRAACLASAQAFPLEREFLFPPLTFLRPTGRKEVLNFAEGEVAADSPAQSFTVLEVDAQM